MHQEENLYEIETNTIEFKKLVTNIEECVESIHLCHQAVVRPFQTFCAFSMSSDTFSFPIASFTL